MKPDKLQFELEKNKNIEISLALEDRIRKDIAHRESLKLIKINDLISNRLSRLRAKSDQEKDILDNEYKKDLLSTKQPISKSRYQKAVKNAVSVLNKLNENNYKVDNKRITKLYNNFINRKDLSNYFIHKNLQKRGRNGKNNAYLKTATATIRDTSYKGISSGKDSFQALSKSIEHLLRILQDRDPSHIEELVSDNLYVFKGKNYTLNSAEDRKNLHTEVLKELEFQKKLFFTTRRVRKASNKKLNTVLKNFRRKKIILLKLLQNVPSDNENYQDVIKDFVNSFSCNIDGYKNESTNFQKELSQKIYNNVRDIFIKHYNQDNTLSQNMKLKYIRERSKNVLDFVNLYDKVVQEKKDNKPFRDSHHSNIVPIFKEFIFKIPHHVGQINSSQQDYIDSTTSYFKKHFPNYDLILTAVHFDETKINDDNKRTGDHVHIILSCRNNVTSEYDFARQYRKYGIVCANSIKPLESNINPNSKELTPKETVRVGQALTYKFMEHMQENLFEKQDICLTLLSSEEKLDLHNIMLTIEQEKTQNSRTLNTINMNNTKKNKLEKELAEINTPENQTLIQNLVEAKKPENQALIQNYNEAKKPESLKLIRYFNQVRRYIKEEETRLDDLKNTNNSNSIIIKKQSEKIEEMVSVNAVLNEWTISLSNDLNPLERFELATETAQTIGDILTDQDFKYDIIDIILKIEEDYKIQSNDKVSNKITSNKKLKI